MIIHKAIKIVQTESATVSKNRRYAKFGFINLTNEGRNICPREKIKIDAITTVLYLKEEIENMADSIKIAEA